MKTFKVTVVKTIKVYALVEVQAVDKRMARRVARRLVTEEPDRFNDVDDDSAVIRCLSVHLPHGPG